MTAYRIFAGARRRKWCRRCCAASLVTLSLGSSRAIAADVKESQGGYASLLSRITIETSLFTRHTQHDELFNDRNWSGVAEVALGRHTAIVAGDFINSYDRNTAFAAFSWLPLNFEFSHLKIDAGGMIGADLNGGYKPHNHMNPFLGALVIKIMGNRFDDERLGILNRVGIGLTIIPAPSGRSTALNLSLRYRLGS